MRIILYKTRNGGMVSKAYYSNSAATKSIKALRGKLKPIESISSNKTKQSQRRYKRRW